MMDWKGGRVLGCHASDRHALTCRAMAELEWKFYPVQILDPSEDDVFS